MRLRLILIILATWITALLAFGDTSSKHQNSLGAVISEDNPWIYNLGALRTGSVFYCSQKKEEMCTSIVLSPFGVDSLNTEQVLFCGDQSEEFKGKNSAVVLVYRRQGTKMYNGIACHNLLAVFQVSFPEKEGVE